MTTFKVGDVVIWKVAPAHWRLEIVKIDGEMLSVRLLPSQTLFYNDSAVYFALVSAAPPTWADKMRDYAHGKRNPRPSSEAA